MVDSVSIIYRCFAGKVCIKVINYKSDVLQSGVECIIVGEAHPCMHTNFRTAQANFA